MIAILLPLLLLLSVGPTVAHVLPLCNQDSWSLEEDAKLRQLHAQYGTSWSRISKCLKGRTSQQCRARWHQINNGRGSSKAAVASAADSGSTAAEVRRHQSAALALYVWTRTVVYRAA